MNKPPLTVLITRPEHQAHQLLNDCRQLGLNALWVPVIQIKPMDINDRSTETIEQLSRADCAIFTSVNAIDYAMPLIQARYGQQLPDIHYACVGERSAARLNEWGIHRILLPRKAFTSEGLLDTLLRYGLEKSRIALFTGMNGRGLLSKQLILEGAVVFVAEVYRREAIHQVDVTVERALVEQNVSAVLISSGEIFRHFMFLYQSQVFINLKMLFVVPSDRIKMMGISLGISPDRIRVAESAHDHSMLNVLIEWQQGISI